MNLVIYLLLTFSSISYTTNELSHLLTVNHRSCMFRGNETLYFNSYNDKVEI
jgi:hypothetical protein